MMSPEPFRAGSTGRGGAQLVASIDPTRCDPSTGKPARDTRWKARYRDPNNRQRSQTFDRKVDAERFLATMVTDTHRGL